MITCHLPLLALFALSVKDLCDGCLGVLLPKDRAMHPSDPRGDRLTGGTVEERLV